MRSWSLAAALAAGLLAAGARGARADEMFAWEKVAQATIRAERLPAARAEQAMTLVRAAIDDAVNATAPYGGGGPSSDVASAVAAHDVLVKLFPARKALLDARLDRVRIGGLDESVVEAAAAAGHRAADSVLSSDWNWRRPRLPGSSRPLPKIKSLTLPLHNASETPLQPPPAARSSRL